MAQWPVLFAVLLALCAPSFARADRFTVALNLTEQLGVYGGYLSAPFDFGTSFSEIESVTLQFVMPGGYQGFAATTGNSSVIRSLDLLLYPVAAPVPEIWQNSATSLGTSALDISAGTLDEFRFVYSVSSGNDSLPLDWPDFLLTGRGQVGWVDEVYASHHPLPDRMPFSSTTSWVLPGEIRSAQLTIVGTPVPEPASVVLIAAGAVIAISYCWIWRRRRYQSAAAER
jgi:hypothetical protein